MRIFFSEYQVDYSTYTFAYAVYCVQEHADELPEIYARGFLPYTGDLTLHHEIFYLARSIRVDLRLFKDSSENRRINRKIEPLGLTVAVTAKDDFDIENPAFLTFCTQYAAERFSGGTMDIQRLRYVCTRNSLSHILTFSANDHILGYAFACITQEILHYWYAFFDVAYLRTHSLGKWMMWRTIRWAKDQGLQHVYLGTCYGPKALYKVRDHRGCEFFDGTGWNRDMNRLKTLCQQDDDSLRRHDAFKSPDSKERKHFHQFLTRL
jgi:arginine-tRNA-protein transferase